MCAVLNRHGCLCCYTLQAGGPGVAAIITSYGRQKAESEQRQQTLKQRMVSADCLGHACSCKIKIALFVGQSLVPFILQA